VNCPYCGAERSIRALHAHLAADHPAEVHTDEQGDRAVYVVTCPYCAEQYRHPIRKSAGSAEFLVEFDRQIRLVAFDMLINHVLAEHDLEPPAR
jgi:hypothetical protein